VMRNGQPQDLSLNVAQVLQEAESVAGSQPGSNPQGQLPQTRGMGPAVQPQPTWERPGGSTTQ